MYYCDTFGKWHNYMLSESFSHFNLISVTVVVNCKLPQFAITMVFLTEAMDVTVVNC